MGLLPSFCQWPSSEPAHERWATYDAGPYGGQAATKITPVEVHTPSYMIVWIVTHTERLKPLGFLGSEADNGQWCQGTRLDPSPAMHIFILLTWVGCLPVAGAVLGTQRPLPRPVYSRGLANILGLSLESNTQLRSLTLDTPSSLCMCAAAKVRA